VAALLAALVLLGAALGAGGCARPGDPPAPLATGAAYHLRLELHGEEEGGGATRPLHELLELDFREVAAPAEAPGGAAAVFVLESLHQRTQRGADAGQEIEVVGDRLRIVRDGRVVVDLEGAQPRARLTAAKLLGHPFAQMRQADRGAAPVVTLRGAPEALDLLRAVAPEGALAWTRVGAPPPGLAAGDAWSAERVPASPPGALGVVLPLRYRVAAVDPQGCARVSIEGRADARDGSFRTGVAFERVLARARGEARWDLRSGRLQRLDLEDDVRVELPPTKELPRRMRYRGFALLELRDPAAADGAGCPDAGSYR
jgi:hypothetical protein